MLTKAEARDLIDDLFEEEALVIGGLLAIHEAYDDFIWRLMKNFDVIRSKFLRRLEGITSAEGSESCSGGANLKPHPAVEEFLQLLRRA